MKKFALVGLFAAVCTVACADVTVKVPNICETSQVGTLYPSYEKTSILTADIDISQEMIQIKSSFDQVYLQLTKLNVTADQNLTWLEDLEITIDGGTASTPKTTLATYHKDPYHDPGSVLPITLVMDANTLFEYLQQPVTLSFTITGSPYSQPANFTSAFCVDLTGEINKH